MSDRKQISGGLEMELWVSYQGQEETFRGVGGGEIFIILIIAVVSQMDTYVKTPQIEYVKCVQQIVC